MLHILGMILKITAILLGSILGIILLVSLLVLFVPFRYRLKGSYQEKPEAAVRITWLFWLLRIEARYGAEGLSLVLRIFGFPLGGRKKQKRREPEEDRAPDKTEEKPAREPLQAALPEEKLERKEAEEIKEDMQGLEDIQEKKSSLRERIRSIWEGIKDKIRGICDKIKYIKQKKDELFTFLKDEKNKEMFRLVKKQLICLWKHVRPRKISGVCHFGFDDPSLTGQALAAASVLYPLYRDQIRLYPDFEQKTLSGELLISGRIRIFPILLIIIRLWRNRQIRILVKKFIK